MFRLPTLLAALAAVAASATAQLIVPSDGSDGAFNPTQNVEVDLGLAPTAPWGTPGTGNGVYDPVQWAVVFKFTEVNIPAGVTVTFKNHPKGAPVVWLVQGNVTIAGTVNLNGFRSPAGGFNAFGPGGSGGPGGFAGGAWPVGSSPSPGFGFGGGNSITSSGSHASYGNSAFAGLYGGAEVVPLIGGSGSAAWQNIAQTGPGQGGGGAILVAAQQSLAVTGAVFANGADGFTVGSGGAIRLAASSLLISGAVQALAGGGNIFGGTGRVRLEANALSVGNNVAPTASVLQPIPNNTPQIWPDVQAAEVRIDSIAGRSVTTDPSGNMSVPDLSITSGGMVPVVLVTRNVPPSWKVTVRVVRQDSSTAAFTQATFNPNTGKWEAMVDLGDGGNYLVAKAAVPGYPD